MNLHILLFFVRRRRALQKQTSKSPVAYCPPLTLSVIPKLSSRYTPDMDSDKSPGFLAFVCHILQQSVAFHTSRPPSDHRRRIAGIDRRQSERVDTCTAIAFDEHHHPAVLRQERQRIDGPVHRLGIPWVDVDAGCSVVSALRGHFLELVGILIQSVADLAIAEPVQREVANCAVSAVVVHEGE